MQHEILGEQYQWLKIQLQSERVRGNYQKLLCKSEDIIIGDGNVFSGTGDLIFSGNGKIKELYMGTSDTIILRGEYILAADVETGQESLSTNWVTLVHFFGPGTVFICGKDFVEFYLKEEKTIEVRTQSIVALDSSVTYRLGSRFSELTGPGAVLLESIIGEENVGETKSEKDILKESIKRTLQKSSESEDEETGFSFFDQL